MVVLEKEILSKLQRGDTKVYEQLFQDNYRHLVLYAKKFVMDTEVARDLVQDVFIYLWDKRQKLTIDKSLSSYLFRAVHNAAINYLKKESTKENYVRQFLINLNEGSYQTSSSEDAHELVVHNELLESIESVVETLPEQCKTIFKMSRFRGMRNKEIAEVYSISPRTVETQLYRALKVLKENIKPNLAVTASLILIIIKSI